MTDCVSNAAELVAETRLSAEYIARLNGGESKDYIPWKAADAIEQLLAENAKLKAERDAAVADIIIACRGERTLCGMCGNNKCEYAGDNQTYCYKCTKYKWRGLQKEEEDATD